MWELTWKLLWRGLVRRLGGSLLSGMNIVSAKANTEDFGDNCCEAGAEGGMGRVGKSLRGSRSGGVFDGVALK